MPGWFDIAFLDSVFAPVKLLSVTSASEFGGERMLQFCDPGRGNCVIELASKAMRFNWSSRLLEESFQTSCFVSPKFLKTYLSS